MLPKHYLSDFEESGAAFTSLSQPNCQRLKEVIISTDKLENLHNYFVQMS